MENSIVPHRRWGYCYLDPKLAIVEQNDRKSKSKSSSSSVRTRDDYRSYQPPKQYLLRESPDLESENLVIYQRNMKVVPSDKVLARITQAEKDRRCPGLAFGACPPEGKCLICSLDEHTSWDCPYALEIPTKNAIVTPHAEIVCKVCDTLLSGEGRCPVCCKQALRRAMLKFCPVCRTFGEQQKCPHRLPDYQQLLILLQQ